MPDSDNDFPSGQDIVDAARNGSDGLTYKLYGYSQGTPAGQPKDHYFVADTLERAGIGFGNDDARPAIAHWADPGQDIPGWQVVRDGTIQSGDVLATAKPIPLSSYHGGGQQLGIATGKGTSIGVVDNDRVGESDFGHKAGHDPVVRRYVQLNDEPPPPRAAPRPAVGAENLPPSPGQEGCPVGGDGGYCPWGSGKGGRIPGTRDQALPPPGLVPGTGDRKMPVIYPPDRDSRKPPTARI